MYHLYSFILTLGFIILLPRFLFDAVFKGKYSEGFWQRFGFLPEFARNGKPVLWVHGVSVGETNAAVPIVNEILKNYPNYSLVVSTTTKTGQALAQKLFKDLADFIFYFPFDWKFTVQRTLHKIKPNLILLMEGEIWFNFIREADKSGANVFIVNGRLSEKSYRRFLYIPKLIKRVLLHVTFAMMQDEADATRIKRLGIRSRQVKLTGNVKFDQSLDGIDKGLTEELRKRFEISENSPLIVAASTHAPEEELILGAFKKVCDEASENAPRLFLVPRHPERFEKVAELVKHSGFDFVKRSDKTANADKQAQIVLIDSVGELRSLLPLAEIVFVGGSLIPHGGQNILEAAAVEKAIITGFYTFNFEAVLEEFCKYNAVMQLPKLETGEVSVKLAEVFLELLANPKKRTELGRTAKAVFVKNRGAAEKTVGFLKPYLFGQIGTAAKPSEK